LAVSVAQRNPEDCWRIGIYSSVTAHVLLAIVVFFGFSWGGDDFPEPIVYSVSIEGGKMLGGKSQVAKDDKPSPISPVKNVTADSSPETEQKPEEKAPEKEIEPAEDAEVSIAEKKATPKPTPAPKVTPKATPKATPPPTKADTKTKQKSDGDEVDKRLQAALQRYLGESSDAGGKGFGAGKVGGAGMGGGVVRPPEFFMYEKILRSRIKEAWRWYDTAAPLITQVAFEIEPDGLVKNVRVTKGSGDSSFDESVVRAVLKASPLPPPPEKVYQLYFKSVRITFDPRE
jgi:TonB family protein